MLDDMEIVYVIGGVEVKVLEDSMEVILPTTN